MTGGRKQDDELFEEAFDLIIRLKSDPDNQVAHELARSWRQRGLRHEEIWSEAVGIHALANTVIRRKHAPDDERTGVSRRAILSGVAAATIAGGAGMAFGPEFLTRLRADAITSTAQLHRIDLPDGSAVTLGPDSAARHTIGRTERRFELLAGMAYFDVAPDEDRPFRVVADRMELTVLGTAFEVSMDAGTTSVAVDHGEVAAASNGRPVGENLTSGQWLSLSQETGAIERGMRENGQVGAWRDSLIVAQSETVAAVVARIARWKSGQVLIADRTLASQRISGVYNLANPMSALQAVVGPHGGTVRSLTPWVTVISRM